MRGKIIAVANSKGGVGKTTTTISLAEAHAAMGLKTLVIDLDFQANASLLVMGDRGDDKLYALISKHRTISDYLELNFLAQEARPLQDFILTGASDVHFKGTALDLSLIPATAGLRVVERELIYAFTEQGYSMSALEGKIRSLLVSDLDILRKQYDVIITDCPPGISAMTEAVLTTSDAVIVPTIPDFLSTLGVDVFCGEIIKQLRKHSKPHIPVVLATKYDSSPGQKIILDAMRDNATGDETAFNMFKTIVPNRPEFAIDPFTLGSGPSLAQKWQGESLAVIDALYHELQEYLS